MSTLPMNENFQYKVRYDELAKKTDRAIDRVSDEYKQSQGLIKILDEYDREEKERRDRYDRIREEARIDAESIEYTLELLMKTRRDDNE